MRGLFHVLQEGAAVETVIGAPSECEMSSIDEGLDLAGVGRLVDAGITYMKSIESEHDESSTRVCKD